MIEQKSSSTKLTAAFLAILFFIRCQPFYFWSIEDIIRPICAILIMLLCAVNFEVTRRNLIIFCLIALSYVWATQIVDHSGLLTLLNLGSLAFIPVIRRNVLFKTYSYFYKIFAFTLLLSIIDYGFVSLGLNFSPSYIDPVNSLKVTKYIQYLFIVQYPETPKFFGMFDEPGVVGTISGLLLVSERFDFSKKGNWILLIGGLLSLSFYFYVVMVFGFILFSKKFKGKQFILIGLVVFVYITYNIPFLYDTLWYRFEYDSDAGTLVGDNRNGNGLKEFYESIKWTPVFFTGLGTRFTEQFQGAASLYLIIVKHGFIFCLLNIGAFIILAFQEIANKKKLLLFLIFFIATLYQRPGFYSPYPIFLYTILIYNFAANENLITNKNEYK